MGFVNCWSSDKGGLTLQTCFQKSGVFFLGKTRSEFRNGGTRVSSLWLCWGLQGQVITPVSLEIVHWSKVAAFVAAGGPKDLPEDEIPSVGFTSD
jgi:hypothetical protein